MSRSLTTEQLFDIYSVDPREFIIDNFGTTPTKQQSLILKSVAVNTRTAIKTGHGIGKTTDFTWLTAWWLSCFKSALAIITATNNNQLYDIYWKELARQFKHFRLAKYFEITDHNKTLSIVGHKDIFAVAKSSERSGLAKQSAMGGFHAENMLILIDEASGVDNVIFESLINTMTGKNNRIVVSGNPLRNEGYFYDIFTKYRESWNCLTFSSLDSPLTDKDKIATIVQDHGAESDTYRTRVLGEFPRHGEYDIFIGLDLMESIKTTKPLSGRRCLGVDVARFGNDRTVITRIDGTQIREILVYKNKDTQYTARKIEYLVKKYEIESVKVDEGSIGGGVVDRLNEMKIPVKGVNFGGKAKAKKKYKNAVAEMYAGFKELVMAGRVSYKGAYLDELIAEMSTRKYAYTPDNLLVIESKKDYKKRAGKSPDIADSVLLAYYTPKLNEITMSVA